jgi:hypothetical protein
MKKASRFTVRKRTDRNRPPKFGLTNAMLQGRKRVLKHHHRSQSPRRSTLRRYNASRPMNAYDIVNIPRQRGRFHEMDIEYIHPIDIEYIHPMDPPRNIRPNQIIQRIKFGLTDAMLQGRKRVLTHHHRSQSPRRATLRRYDASRPMNAYDIVNTPRHKGRFLEIDVEPVQRESSSSSERKSMSRK